MSILGHNELLDLLLEENTRPSNRNHNNSQLDYALAGAVFGGHLDLVRRLLGVGANPSSPVECGIDPPLRIIHIAAFESKLSIVKALIDPGAKTDIEEPSMEGFQPSLFQLWQDDEIFSIFFRRIPPLYEYSWRHNPINLLLNGIEDERFPWDSVKKDNDYLKVAELLIHAGARIGSSQEKGSPYYRLAEEPTRNQRLKDFAKEILDLFSRYGVRN